MKPTVEKVKINGETFYRHQYKGITGFRRVQLTDKEVIAAVNQRIKEEKKSKQIKIL